MGGGSIEGYNNISEKGLLQKMHIMFGLKYIPSEKEKD